MKRYQQYPTPYGGVGYYEDDMMNWWRFIFLCVCIAFIAGCGSLTTSESNLLPPIPTPDTAPTGRIAFVSDRDGNPNIYSMNVDGTNSISLTHHAEFDGLPTWSPDGTHIAFVSYRDGTGNIYLMKADGSTVTRLTDTTTQLSSPAWSPDGTHIAFTFGPVTTTEIGIIKADGTDFRLLTNNDTVDQLPAWSPDGTRIAFSCERPRYLSSSISIDLDICVMNADGSSMTRLMNDDPPDICPAWSPDGTRIAFLSSRHDPDNVHNVGIYLMYEDGSGITPLITFLDNRVLDCPSWSPDGKRLIFSMLSSNGRGKELYYINADGSDLTMLTNKNTHDWDPDWAP